jgi:hypothetical protein
MATRLRTGRFGFQFLEKAEVFFSPDLQAAPGAERESLSKRMKILSLEVKRPERDVNH